jgi:Flp pilus assembly protein TadD
VLAAATADLVAHEGRGNAAGGVRAARRARALNPTATEALFWEGACHDAVGRGRQAVACYRQFTSEAAGIRRLRKLVGRAVHRVHLLSER